MNNHTHQANTSAAHAGLSPSTRLDDEIEEHGSSCCLSDMEKAMLGEDVVPCGGCFGTKVNYACCTIRSVATRVLFRGPCSCPDKGVERDLTIFILNRLFGYVHSDPLPDRCLDSCPRNEALVPNEFVEKLVLRIISCQQKSDEEYCQDLTCESEEVESLGGMVATLEVPGLLSVSSETPSSPSSMSVNANEVEEIVNQWGFGGFGIKFRGECVIAHAECEKESSHDATHLLMGTMIAIIRKLDRICQSCIASWLRSRGGNSEVDWTYNITEIVPNWERHSRLDYNEERPLAVPHGSISTTSLWTLTHSTWNLYMTPAASGLGLMGRAIALADEEVGSIALLKSGYIRFTTEEIYENREISYLSVKNGYEDVLMLSLPLQRAISTATRQLYESAEGSDIVASEQGLTSRRLRIRKRCVIAALILVPFSFFGLAALITRLSGANISGLMTTLAGMITSLMTAILWSNNDARRWLRKGARVSRRDMTDADKAKCIILANSSSTASRIFDGKKMGPTGLLYSGSLEPGRPLTAKELTALGYIRVRGRKVVYNWVTGDWRRITFEGGSARLVRTGELVGNFEVKAIRSNYFIQ